MVLEYAGPVEQCAHPHFRCLGKLSVPIRLLPLPDQNSYPTVQLEQYPAQ